MMYGDKAKIAGMALVGFLVVSWLFDFENVPVIGKLDFADNNLF